MVSFFVGFDGYIDILYHAVKHRLNRMEYTPYATLAEFGAFIQSSAQKSCNIESVRLATTLGGNAPLLALGLKTLSHSVELVGCLGYPTIHPIFQTLLSNSHSIGEAGTTSAFEFQDGKLLLGSMNEVLSLTMPDLFSRCPNLNKLLGSSSFLVTVNWTMCPLVQEFWKWLLTLPKEALQGKSLFVDLADPKKRSQQDLAEAMALLVALSKHLDCYIGFNRSEATLTAESLGIRPKGTLEEIAVQLASCLPNLSLYLHDSKGAVAISSSCELQSLPVNKTNTPLRLTGAGDMFNVGILSALSNKLPLKEQVQRALATSGHWVRTGLPATVSDLYTSLPS